MTGSITHAHARLSVCGIVAAFALALAATLMAFAAPAQAAESLTADVYASAQTQNNFLFAPQKVTVSSTEAEGLGYTDAVPSSESVSQLDVIVKMHELTFGDDFAKDPTTYLDVSASGWVDKAFGEDSGYWGIAQNDKAAYDSSSDYQSYGYTGYLVNRAPVSSNDSVSVFYYYDTTAYTDGFSYFTVNGEYANSVSATTGKAISLTVKELPNFMGDGTKNDEDRAAVTTGLANAQLTLVNAETGEQTDIANTVTDAQGTASITFDTPGTYLVSAKPADGANVASPLVFVSVTNAAPVTPGTKTDVNKTNAKKATAKVSKGYTAKVAGAKYTVTSASKKTVTYVKAPTGKKTVKVPATVKLADGKTYKVTKIAAKAFKSNKTVTKVVVGKNVTKIAKSAFYHTPKLHTVQVASKHLKKAATVKASFKGSKLKSMLKVTTAKGVAKKYVKKSFTKKNLAAPQRVRVA